MSKKAHENMGNIVSYLKNANQKYNEVSPHISQNGHYKKSKKINTGMSVEKREPSFTVRGDTNW